MTGTIQNVLGAVPVRYQIPPPEGPKALPIQFILGAAQQVVAKLINLSDWQMSQVVSAIVDNSASDVDIQVTMGATNTVVQVPALAEAIIPAFSNGPSFNILILAKESPAGGEQIVITLLNFEKQPAIYSYAPIQVAGNLNANITNAAIAVTGSVNANITNASIPVTGSVNANITNASIPVTGSVNANITNASLAVTGSVNIGTVSGSVTIDDTSPITIQNTIINTGLNTAPLVASVVQFTGNQSVTVVGLPSGGWILESVDLCCEYVNTAAAGAAYASFTLASGAGDTFHICAFQPTGTGTGAVSYSGTLFGSPLTQTFPQGLLLPRGYRIDLVSSGWTNLTSMGIRVNITGYNAP